MSRVPRNVTQAQVVRALVRGGGREVRGRGKGSHRYVAMPGIARPVIVPAHIGPGLLRGIIKDAGLTVAQFAELL